MQISELSARTQVPVPTVKYYLREGLLAPGVATSATRAEYDDQHVRRLRLIRALAEFAGLRLDQIRGVLSAVDDEQTSLHDALGSALGLHAPGAAPDDETRARVDALVRRWGWDVSEDSPHRDTLARALASLVSLDHPMPPEMLDLYGAELHRIATAEVESVPTTSREEAVVHAVIGTLLVEPVLSSIRKMAHEEISSRRLAHHAVRTAHRTRD
ncbi:MAG: MerR family transcriptional regulator [Nocardioidaceae bacterium]